MALPTISILLSVYNGATNLKHCLTSIEQQTFKDFELIYIDDAATDTSLKILYQWHEAHPHVRMTILRNTENQGLTRSLMRGLSVAQGTYIARIDADDWWLPNKLEKQFTFLEQHPDYGIVGCWYMNVRTSGEQQVQLPVSDVEIRKSIFWRNPFGHSCVVIRKKVLDTVGGYSTALRYGQDRDLWFKLLPHTKLSNIPNVLCYRTVDRATSTTKTRAQIWQQFKTVHKYIWLYHSSPLAYVSFIEPLLIFLTPSWLRNYGRSIYDRISTN